MLLRVPLIQIILLNIALLVVSLLDLHGLSPALAEVRLPLVMVLGVAVLYLGLLLRNDRAQLLPVRQEDDWPDQPIEIERGA